MYTRAYVCVFCCIQKKRVFQGSRKGWLLIFFLKEKKYVCGSFKPYNSKKQKGKKWMIWICYCVLLHTVVARCYGLSLLSSVRLFG